MSFNFLPWQMQVIVGITAVVFLIFVIIKTNKDTSKSFKVGYACIAFGGILTAMHKLSVALKIWKDSSILTLISFITIMVGVGVIMICGYISSEDPAKKKAIRTGGIVILVTLIIMLILILAAIFLKLKHK